MLFEHLGLSQPVLRAVSAAGYDTPTEIQAAAIPPALSGSDVIGRAKTGSGKTAAFVLPIIDRLLEGGRPARGVVRALVLTPTRELAQQVSDASRKYGRYTKLSNDAMYGGVSIEPQFKRLRKGLDILAATPGRLLDHMERGSIDLSRCEVLIVDEADRMFDMGFIKDVRRIIKALPSNRQTLLFSATMSKEVRTLSADIMKDPVFVEVGIEGNPAESVRQQFYAVQKNNKIDALFHLLQREKMESVLVFSRTKHGANKIAKRLEGKGIGTGVLHSNKSQSQRLSALSGFRDGRHRVLVATDIAARGIDVVGISHVINYDTPAFAEDYVHRIGRTGRADATGDAITFVAHDERDYLRKIERFVGKRYVVEQLDGYEVTDVPMQSDDRSEHVPAREQQRRAPRNQQRGKRSSREFSGSRGYKGGGREFNGERRENGNGREFNGERREYGKPREFNGERREYGKPREYNGERREYGKPREYNGERRENGKPREFNGERRENGKPREFNGERRENGKPREFAGKGKRPGGQQRSGAGREERPYKGRDERAGKTASGKPRREETHSGPGFFSERRKTKGKGKSQQGPSAAGKNRNRDPRFSY